MANIYQEQENLDKALEYIRLGRGLFEYDVDLIIAELNYHLANQDFEKAEELLTLAIEEDPNNHQLFFALGVVTITLVNSTKLSLLTRKQ